MNILILISYVYIVFRTELALFFWSETQKPLQMSVAATALYWRLNMSYENEEKSIYVDKKKVILSYSNKL